MYEHLLPGDVSPDASSDFESSADSDAPASAFGAGVEDGASQGAPARRKRRARKKTAKKADESSAPTETAAPSGDAAEGATKKPARKRRKKSTSARKATQDDAADDGRENPRAEDSGGGDSGAEDSGVDDRPRKKAGRTRRRAAKADGDERDAEATDAAEAQDGDGDGADGSDGSDGTRRKRRRRGSRGGRRRKSAREDDDALAVDSLPGEEDDFPRDEDDSDDSDDGRASKKGRSRRSSKKKSSRRGSTSDDRDEATKDDEGAKDDDGTTRKKRRRRRRKSGADKDATSKENEDRDVDDDADDDEDAPKSTKKKRSRSRKKKTDAPEKSEEELAAEAEALRTQTILVNAVEPEEKRVVVLEDDRIVDLLMTAESQKTLVNDVYRGKVVNLEPAIGAAFIDFGQGRNGFLHTSDVLPMYGEDGFKIEQLLTARVDDEDWDDDDRVDSKDLEDDGDDGDDDGKASSGASRGKKDDDADDGDEGDEKSKGGAKRSKTKAARGKSARTRRKGRDRRPISDLLRVGDPVVVQITKDAIGDKGPTLTTYISIPGRYLVLMPSMSRTGVSRKIPDDKERRRLKRILAGLNVPEDMGVIVRTAGIGKKKVDLQRDLEYLLGVWEGFGRKLRGSRGPSPLYQESDVSTRTLRDLFNAKTKRVVVDDYSVHEQMVEFAEKLMPEHRHRIELYDGDRPIFHQFGTEQDFEKVFARRVDLPSGGSIVFDQAEALVAIDVNSGRTRTDSFDFEKIALKTNLEAVPEIARQIRLRDLGGILVCDFIDMMKPSSNRQVERALRTALADDRARSKLGRISQFGLLEMTRQRLGPGTHKKVFQACPRCRGTARIRTMESRAQAILRRLGSALTQKGFSTVEVRAHPEVVQYLKEDLYDYIRAMEHRTEREIRFASVPDQVEDSVLRYLRADGREVRPGGRRKK